MSLSSVVRSTIASLLVSAAVVACGGSASTSAKEPKPAASDPSCPVAVAGTSVTVEDTDTGAALVFVTTGDVAELRRRVGTMAQMHNDHHGKMGALPDASGSGGGHEGHDMSGHSGHDMGAMKGSGDGGHDMADMKGHDMGDHAGHAGGMISVHSNATAGEIEGGAKLAFTASAVDVAKLQSELRMHAQHLASGSCAMDHQ